MEVLEVCRDGQKKKMRIIWSVDLFEGETFKKSQVVNTLKLLANKESGAEIEPVYVLSPEGLDLALEFSPP
jgi:hypothetical protein